MLKSCSYFERIYLVEQSSWQYYNKQTSLTGHLPSIMASSHTNGNVEAYLVPQDAVASEKTTYGHGARAKRQIHPSLLLHLVSFTAVIWLIVQVFQLQYELVGLRAENTTIGGLGWYDGQHHPSQQADAENIQDTNVKSNTGLRSRRQVQPSDGTDTSSSVVYDTLYCDGLPSLHVVGNQQDQLVHSTESWFTFHTSGDTGMLGRISHESLKFVHNKFIEITMPGYYFVYSQICYPGYGYNLTGHEVVVRPDCGDGTEVAILESRALQVTHSAGQRPSGDSGYAGGVFYLAANDRVGVRPHRGDSSYFTKDDGQASYFGAFLLSKSSDKAIDPNFRCCP